MKLKHIIAIAACLCWTPAALAAPLSVDLVAAKTNPAAPQMGDHLSFRTTIRNTGTQPIDGVIAWISLVQIDRGKEQPVDLEDWSAHKAVTASSLKPGAAIKTTWPMRLIKSGHYRVVVSAATRSGAALSASPFADFYVRQKPVVELNRVLPVALGLPLLFAGGLAWQWRRRRAK